MFIDTHTHLDHPKFDATREEVIARARKCGVDYFINAAINYESNKNMDAKLGKFENIYYSVGIHPNYVGNIDESDDIWEKDLLNAVFRGGRVVAIGETGLDYSRLGRTCRGKLEVDGIRVILRQFRWFRRHMKLAAISNKPLILHIRSVDADAFRQKRGLPDDAPIMFEDAHTDALVVLKEYQSELRQGEKGVVHCYTSPKLEHALEYIELGYLIGLGGAISFEQSDGLREVVKAIPLDKIVLETDSPYVRPVGIEIEGKNNTPESIPFIAAKIAELKGITVEEVEEATTANAKRLFGI